MYPKWYQLMDIYIVAYHRRALCDKKEPNIPGVEGDREARSYQQGRVYHKSVTISIL